MPDYLAIDGHQNCLKEHKATEGVPHPTNCLPQIQPENCSTDAWGKLTVMQQDGSLLQCQVEGKK